MIKTMRLALSEPISMLVIGPNHDRLAAASNTEVAERVLGVWQIPSVDNTQQRSSADVVELPFQAWLAPSDEVNALALSPRRGACLASACGGEPPEDGAVSLWALDDSSLSSTPRARQAGRITAMAWAPLGQLFVTGAESGAVRLWPDAADDPEQLAAQTAGGHDGAVRAVAFSGDGARLASCGDDGAVLIWARGDGGWRSTARLDGHGGPVLCVAWRSDGRAMATGSRDCRVGLWAVPAGGGGGPGGGGVGGGWASREALAAGLMAGHVDAVRVVAWGPHGDCVASGGDDRRVWLWSARAGRAVAGPLCLDVWQISVAMPVSSPRRVAPSCVRCLEGRCLAQSLRQALTV